MDLQEMFVKESQAHAKRKAVTNPKDIVGALGKRRICARQEHFWVFLLDGAHKVIKTVLVTKGLVNRTLVHPREVFRPAIVANCVSIVVAHNHPSGNLEPSSEDIEVTKRLKQAGDLLGIAVLDHILVSKTGYYSFIENRGYL